MDTKTNIFIEKANKLDCSIFIANSLEHIKNLHNSNFHLLITYGDSYDEYKNDFLNVNSENMLIGHIHLSPTSDIFSNVNIFNITINNFYIEICSINIDKTNGISKKKIFFPISYCFFFNFNFQNLG